MSSIVKTAHGLVAGQRVSFSDLVGGVGIDVDTIYFVVPVVNANDFQIAETEDGTPITFTTVTSANMIVVPETTDTDSYPATYTAVSDPVDVMAPPTVPATPSAPTLTSDTTTGVVRLVIALPAVVDARVRRIEIEITNEYTVPASAPASPIWTSASIQHIDPAITQISIRAHPQKWYSSRIRVEDVYGNVSAWSSVDDEQTVAGYDSINAIASATASLLDHQIGTVEIEEGAITADLLAATIILGSNIIAGDPDAQRVEMNLNGIQLLDSSDNPVVVIPTDADQPVFVDGNVVAGSLISEDSAEFRTEASLAASAVMTLQSGVTTPASAPTLIIGYEQVTGSLGPSGNEWGLCWNGTHLCVPRFQSGSSGIVQIEKWTTAGVLASTITTDLNLASGYFIDGLAWDGTYFYVLSTNATTVNLTKLNSSGATQSTTNITADISGSKGQVGGLFWDATTSLLVVTTTVNATASTQYRFRRYNVSTMTLSSTVDASGYTVDATTTAITSGARLSTEYWVGAYSGATLFRPFTATTGAYVSNGEWGYTTSGSSSAANAGLAHDGTNFYFRTSTLLNKATNWDWTTASSLYWVCYAWYDSDASGGTHETAVGPRASITMYRRMRLSVANATLPADLGGADDVDSVRIYMKPNATDPGAGAFKRQTTDSATQRYLITYDSAGGADGAGTAFPAATPAQLKTAGGEWVLKGNGLINLVGTSFPANPSADDHFYRSDLDMEFFYDGTRWLSAKRYSLFSSVLENLAASGTGMRAVTPSLDGCSDIWLERIDLSFFVTAGTALGASHKWVGTMNKDPGATSVTTFTIDSGASNAWRRHSSIDIDALLTAASFFEMSVSWVKTGTPGNLYGGWVMNYRLVAT